MRGRFDRFARRVSPRERKDEGSVSTTHHFEDEDDASAYVGLGDLPHDMGVVAASDSPNKPGVARRVRKRDCDQETGFRCRCRNRPGGERAYGGGAGTCASVEIPEMIVPERVTA